MDELRFIRKIWLNEKHECDDALPRIYLNVTGKQFEDSSIVRNKYYGKSEWDLLADVCADLYPDHKLMLELESSLLDIEARNSAISSSRNVIKNLEAKIKQSYFKDEDDAKEMMRQRRIRSGISSDAMEDDSELDTDEKHFSEPLRRGGLLICTFLP